MVITLYRGWGGRAGGLGDGGWGGGPAAWGEGTYIALHMSLDPFSVLGIVPRFDIEGGEVQRAYLRRAAAGHPDRAGRQGSGEESVLGVADLNEARAALSDPERRANALLELLGGPTKEGDKSLPPGFLMEMMEAREAMEADFAARAGREASKGWAAWVEGRRRAMCGEVGRMFVMTPVPLGEIRRQLNAWRYIERMAEELERRGDV